MKGKKGKKGLRKKSGWGGMTQPNRRILWAEHLRNGDSKLWENGYKCRPHCWDAETRAESVVLWRNFFIEQQRKQLGIHKVKITCYLGLIGKCLKKVTRSTYPHLDIEKWSIQSGKTCGKKKYRKYTGTFSGWDTFRLEWRKLLPKKTKRQKKYGAIKENVTGNTSIK